LLRRFWLLIRQGLSAPEAAVAVGVSKRTGALWLVQAGGMPPLQLVAGVSGRHVSAADRQAIHAGLMAGCCYAAIARSIGRPTSTVTRELEANRLNPSRPRAVPLGARAGARGPVPASPNYSPLIAQQRFESRLSRPKTSKLADNDRLKQEVQARLKQNHSPEQVSARLVIDFPDDPEMRVSHETIYGALYVQGRGALNRELTRAFEDGPGVAEAAPPARATAAPDHRHGLHQRTTTRGRGSRRAGALGISMLLSSYLSEAGRVDAEGAIVS
jgi:IS30 family transposase